MWPYLTNTRITTNYFRHKKPYYFGFLFALYFFITIAQSAEINPLKCEYYFNIRFSEPARTVYIHQKIDILTKSGFDTDILYLHFTSNAFASSSSQYYQESENHLDEPLKLFIQSVKSDGQSCDYVFNDITSMVLTLPEKLPVNQHTTIEIDYTITIPEGNHPACPSYRGSDYRLLQFYPVVERPENNHWVPEKYNQLSPSEISPANYYLELQLPQKYSVVGSLHIDSVSVDTSGQQKHWFHPANIRELSLIFSSNQTVIPLSHKGISISIMMPKATERRFRLSKNKVLQKVTQNIIDYFSDSIIPYPHRHLAVSSTKIPGNVTTSNLIMLSSKAINDIANLDYNTIHDYAQSIAEQYFHYYIFEEPNESDWINTGLASYFASNYMSEQYQGLRKIYSVKEEEKIKPTDTILRMAAFATDQENIGRPIQSRHTNTNTPLLIEHIYYYKSQKVLSMMQSYIGDSVFQKSLLEFLDTYAYQSTSSRDFINILEKNSQKDLTLFEELWINSDNIPDNKIKKVRHIRNNATDQYETKVISQGDALRVLPIEIEAIDDNFDTLRTMTDVCSNGRDTITFYSQFPLRKIVLDPQRKIWEFNRLNNNYPSKILFNFLIAIPSIDAYQIFYYPTFDFNERDASRIGIKLRGRYWINMRPLFPSQSLDEWTLGFNYGLRSKTVGYDVSYSTSILALFFQPRIQIRSRDYFGLNETSIKTDIYLGKINYPLLHKIQGYKKLTIGVRYQDVRTLEFLNKNNWETGKLFNPYAEFINYHNWGDFRHISRINFWVAAPLLDTDYNSQKLVFDTQIKYRPQNDLWLYERIFIGVSGGKIPLQNYFYFFGKNTLENMSFNSFRLVKGAGDMRGYGADSPKDQNIITSNTEFRWSYAEAEPAVFDLILFFDSGLISSSIYTVYKKQIKHDAGIGTEFNALEELKIGIHIPFWVSNPVDDKPPFALRWVLSVDLNL